MIFPFYRPKELCTYKRIKGYVEILIALSIKHLPVAFSLSRPQDVIIFIVGGTTYEEARSVALQNASNSGVRFILGGSVALNSKRYSVVIVIYVDAILLAVFLACTIVLATSKSVTTLCLLLEWVQETDA